MKATPVSASPASAAAASATPTTTTGTAAAGAGTATATVVATPAEVDSLRRGVEETQDTATRLNATRQQLSLQLTENEMVRAEMELLRGRRNAEVMRAVGPTLLKTDWSDAASLVDARIAAIKADMAKVQEQIDAAMKRRKELVERLQAVAMSYSAAQPQPQPQGQPGEAVQAR